MVYAMKFLKERDTLSLYYLILSIAIEISTISSSYLKFTFIWLFDYIRIMILIKTLFFLII